MEADMKVGGWLQRDYLYAALLGAAIALPFAIAWHWL